MTCTCPAERIATEIRIVCVCAVHLVTHLITKLSDSVELISRLAWTNKRGLEMLVGSQRSALQAEVSENGAPRQMATAGCGRRGCGAAGRAGSSGAAGVWAAGRQSSDSDAGLSGRPGWKQGYSTGPGSIHPGVTDKLQHTPKRSIQNIVYLKAQVQRPPRKWHRAQA